MDGSVRPVSWYKSLPRKKVRKIEKDYSDKGKNKPKRSKKRSDHIKRLSHREACPKPCPNEEKSHKNT